MAQDQYSSSNQPQSEGSLTLQPQDPQHSLSQYGSNPPSASESSSTGSPAAAPARYFDEDNLDDTRRVNDLRADGHHAAADRILRQQKDKLAVSEAVALALGQDPNTFRLPTATGLHDEVELERFIQKQAERMAGFDRISREEGLDKVTESRNRIVESFKARQDEMLNGDPAQFEPVVVDPNELADARFRLARIHNRMRREVDPSYDLYRDPNLSTLTATFREGAVEEGEQELPIGVVGKATLLAMKPVEALLWDFPIELLYGVDSLGAMVVRGMSDGAQTFHFMPGTYDAVDENGQVFTNQPKVSMLEGIAAAWQTMVHGQVTEDVANLGAVQELAEAQRGGLWNISASVAHGFGYFTGLGPVFGGTSQVARKGLSWLGSLGKTGDAFAGKRARALLHIMSTSVGGAATEALLHGNIHGYGKSGIQGAMLGPILWGAGLTARRLEGFFQQHKVPAVLARQLAGLGEGLMFTVPSQETWELLKDPTKENWQRYSQAMVVNMLTFGILRGMHGQTPGEHYDSLLEPELMPRTKLPAEPEAQREAKEQLRTAEVEARESYTVEAREGRVLPVVEHKGEAAPTFSHAEALEKGLPSRYVGEREVSSEEALQRKTEERRKGQRGRDPLEDPEFQRLPEDLKAAMLATKDVGERMRLWNESAERVLRPELEALKQKIEAEGRGPALEDMRKLSLRAMGTSLEGEVRTLTHGAPILKEKKGFQVPAEASREARFYKEQLEQRERKTREQERFAEFGRKMLSAEQAKKRPELRRPAYEAVQRARQELAREVRGPKGEERVQEEREELYEEIKTGRSFPAGRGEAVEGTEPIRASDIILRAQGVHPEHPIKFAVRTKRQGHWARGWYSSQQRLVRSAEANDLNNIAHEFAHAMQDQTIGLRWVPKNKSVKQELLEIGRPLYRDSHPTRRKIAEGWAEFWARDLLGDPDLAAQYPNAHRFLKAWISAPEQANVLKQYKHLAEGYQQYRDQGALGRRRASTWYVGDKPSPEQRALWGSKWKQIKQWADRGTDDIAKIRQSMARHGFKVGELPIDADPYRMASINRMRAPGVADTFLYRATLGEASKRTGEGAKQALSELKESEYQDWADYTIARLELELSDKGFKTTLSREDNLTVVAQLGNPRFEKTTQRVKEFMDRLVDYLALHGGITPVSAHFIKESSTVYLPMFRMIFGPKRAGAPSRGVAERGTGVGHRKGSTREIRDPIQSMIEVTHSIVSKAHKAQVMKSFYTASVIKPGIGGLVTEVKRDARPIELQTAALRQALEKIGVETKPMEGMTDADLASVVTLFELAGKPAGHEGIIVHTPTYSEKEIEYWGREYGEEVAKKLTQANGKTKWLEVDPEMFEGLMGVDMENAMNVPRAVSFTTRLMKLGYTGLAPAFTLKDMFRTTVMLPMFSATERRTRFVPLVGGLVEMWVGGRAQLKGRNPIASIARKMGKQVDVDPIAQIILDAGGKGSTFMGEATTIGQPKYMDLITRTPAEQVQHALVHPARAALKGLSILEKGLAEAESFARTNEGIMAYERALREGKTEEQAVLEGLESFQEITQNYVRNGPLVRALGRVSPYFSARVGSYRRLGRILSGAEGKEQFWRAWGQGALNIGTLGALTYILYGDEKWWQGRPDWQKNNFWSLRFGDVRMDLPKPFEYGILFSNPVEWALGQIAGTSKDSAFELVKDMLVPEMMSFAILPSLIGPSVEAWANKSWFTGRSIVPEWMEDRLAPEKRERVYTSWIAKQIGHALGISPLKVEYVMGAHTGGLAVRVARSADALFGLREELRPHDTMTTQEQLAEIPGIGDAFFSQGLYEQSAAVQRFYELHRELNQTKEPRHEALRLEIGRARQSLSEIYKAQREGRMTREEADERAYRIAHPLVERYERRK